MSVENERRAYCVQLYSLSKFLILGLLIINVTL